MKMKPYYIRVYPDYRHTKVITIPIFEDNYVYVLTDDSKKSFIVDPGIGEPICNVIEELGLEPEYLLITHSHHDHIGGVKSVLGKYPNVKVIDYSHCREESQKFTWNNRSFSVFKTPGHLNDHICFFEIENKILFCGDILFRFGCGRIFVGTFNELFQSLQKVKKLPEDTDIYCTHEYTRQNLAFCIKQELIDPKDFSKKEKELIESTPSLPVKLETELKYNPFLKAATLEQLTQLRLLRNDFKSET